MDSRPQKPIILSDGKRMWTARDASTPEQMFEFVRLRDLRRMERDRQWRINHPKVKS